MTNYPDVYALFAKEFPHGTPAQIRALLAAGSTAERFVALVALCPEGTNNAVPVSNKHAFAN